MPREAAHNISRDAELAEEMSLCQMAEALSAVNGRGWVPKLGAEQENEIPRAS